MPKALAMLSETNVERLTVVCAAASIEFCLAKSGCESRPRCESHPAGCDASLCLVVHPMADLLDMGRRGFLSADHQSTGDQNGCLLFLDFALPSRGRGLPTWDWRKVAEFLNVVS